MDFGITGKKALVLGGSGGLGLAIATELAREGADVTIISRSSHPDGIELEGGLHLKALSVDLSTATAAREIYEHLKTADDLPDILINNSGGPAPASALEQDIDALKQGFQTLVLTQVELAQLCAQEMKQRGWGRILGIASSSVISPIPNLAASTLLRAGYVSWAKMAATELAEFGVTVNVLIPGRIDTNRLRRLDEAQASRTAMSVEAVKAASFKKIPMGRYGHVEEFASMAAFLCSARASYVTGSQIRIDGGLLKNI